MVLLNYTWVFSLLLLLLLTVQRGSRSVAMIHDKFHDPNINVISSCHYIVGRVLTRYMEVWSPREQFNSKLFVNKEKWPISRRKGDIEISKHDQHI